MTSSENVATMTPDLAINGGTPVRTEPLPWEWCGTHHMDELEAEAAARVVRSRSLFRYYGPDLQGETEALEREFAAYVGKPHALGVNSGTGALQVALGALGIGPGDEVILPGYFWVATVAAVVRSGAIPVLADSDNTFSIDPDKVAEKITPRTRAIITVHMGGVIGRVVELAEVARRHGLKLIEDCAQAAGASQNDRMAGSFGDVAIFSLQLNKHMTSGEGGLLVTGDREIYRRAFAIHDLGYPRNADGRLEFDNPDTQLWGIGVRMSELTAAVARVQLSKLNTITGCMRRAKNRIREAIAGIDCLQPRRVIDPAGDAGSFLYLTLPERELSLRFVEALKAEGICAAKGGMYPVHMDDWGLHIYHNIPSLVNKRGLGALSVWDLAENAEASVSYDKGACPHLDSLLDRTLLICIASNLQEQDIRDIIEALRKVAEGLT